MTTQPAFSLARQPLELKFRFATLTEREWLTPRYVRVRVSGPDMVGFLSRGADDHMRLFFPDNPVSTVEEMREHPSREYTPLAWGDNWLDIEFAVHGDEGIAAPWSAKAPVGAMIGVAGPRGSMIIDGTPGGWLLAGDETAIPAIRRFAQQIGDTPARILIEVSDASDEISIDAPVAIEWIHRGDTPAGSALAAALDTLGPEDVVGTNPFCFIAAEQMIVKPGRALLQRWGVDVERAVVKGYWKREA